MDTTQPPPSADEPTPGSAVEDLLEHLETADPADAAPVAEQIATRLAKELDAATGAEQPPAGGAT